MRSNVAIASSSRCAGGPCLSRLETFPPRMEIEEKTGLYILVDDEPCDWWIYQFVPTSDL